MQDLRVERGWSREQLAVLCSFHVTYIGQVERGEKNISFDNLLKFSRAFGVTISALLAGLEAETPLGDLHSVVGNKVGRSSAFQVQALVKRLIAQRTGMDKTISLLASAISPDAAPIGKSRRKRGRSRKQAD